MYTLKKDIVIPAGTRINGIIETQGGGRFVNVTFDFDFDPDCKAVVQINNQAIRKWVEYKPEEAHFLCKHCRQMLLEQGRFAESELDLDCEIYIDHIFKTFRTDVVATTRYIAALTCSGYSLREALKQTYNEYFTLVANDNIKLCEGATCHFPAPEVGKVIS